MRVDHVGYAAGPEGLQETARSLAARLGVRVVDGGPHPRFGTRNVVLPLSGGAYVEVVEVLDHPVAEKALFGRAVRERSEAGGGWFAWSVTVDDLDGYGERLGEEIEEGARRRPDGVELRWRQIGVPALRTEPQLPLLIEWSGPATQHPSALSLAGGTRLTGLTIAGQRQRVRDWLGLPPEFSSDHVRFTWLDVVGSPRATGLRAVTFETPRGTVEI
ncbi:VOC family protein [Kineococcus sp. SYSU DK002]|uniref:VOC family protein n=1 Tax=Kineococcus sp. SYSU DK002 TaxID=3383123 RepID=UPI003D7CB172